MSVVAKIKISQLAWQGSTKKKDGTIYKRNVFLVDKEFFGQEQPVIMVADNASTKYFFEIVSSSQPTAAKPAVYIDLVHSIRLSEQGPEVKFEITLQRTEGKLGRVVFKRVGGE